MRGISRGQLYAFIWLLLTANGLPSIIGEAVVKHGWLVATFNLFDVSAIVWIAVAAGLALAWDGARGDEPRRFDWQLAGAACVAALVPVVALSGAAMTAVSLAVMLHSSRGSELFRAAAIFLSVSAYLLWGRLALALGAGPLLSADARFVSAISGLPSNGNTVGFTDGTRFMIAPGCSSLHGISLALILWTTALAWFDLRPTRRLVWTLIGAVAASIVVNGVRLTAIAWNPESFSYWHIGTGAALFGWAGLLAIGAVVFFGVRSALDAR